MTTLRNLSLFAGGMILIYVLLTGCDPESKPQSSPSEGEPSTASTSQAVGEVDLGSTSGQLCLTLYPNPVACRACVVSECTLDAAMQSPAVFDVATCIAWGQLYCVGGVDMVGDPDPRSLTYPQALLDSCNLDFQARYSPSTNSVCIIGGAAVTAGLVYLVCVALASNPGGWVILGGAGAAAVVVMVMMPSSAGASDVTIQGVATNTNCVLSAGNTLVPLPPPPPDPY
jgi:hypothetical protein